MPESFVEIRRHRGRGDAPTEAATEVYLRLAPSTVVLEDGFALVIGELDTSSGRTVVLHAASSENTSQIEEETTGEAK